MDSASPYPEMISDIAASPATNAMNQDAIRSYPPEAWEAQKPVIERLYRAERRSTAFVKATLHRRGFHVNDRMIKTRVRKWGFDKKHKEVDMRTAMALMEHNTDRWARRSPRFRIRGQIVTYTDILTYFRRRQIKDPIAWVRAQAGDGFVASAEVELINPSSSDDEASEPGSPPTLPIIEETESPIEEIQPPQEFPIQHHHDGLPVWRQEPIETAREQALALSLQGTSIIHPAQHLLGDQTAWFMRDYVAAYIESPRASTHKEPMLHRFTLHANFAQRMQQGIFSMKKNDLVKGFNAFQGGFDMIREMLRNDHPMCISMLLSVICELNKNNHPAVVLQLTNLALEMARIERKQSHQLISVFETLDRAGTDAANLSITALKVAIDFLSRRDPQHWKVLYLTERLCDALYYVGMSGQGAALRARLLVQQERKYGKHARNVLWTLTNVADDDLQRGDLVMAEKRFRDALARSNTLEGYERGNGRFKALEGLAKTAIARADQLHLLPVPPFTSSMDSASASTAFSSSPIATSSSPVSPSSPQQLHDPNIITTPKALQNQKKRKLSDAFHLLKDAETEATTWFDGPRRIRVSESIQAVKRRMTSE